MNQSTGDNEYTQLRSLAPSAKHYVLLCNNVTCTDNFHTFTSTWSRSDDSPWLIDLVCTVCAYQWSICCECANFKTPFTTMNQIKQHRYTYHNPDRPNKRKEPSHQVNVSAIVEHESGREQSMGESCIDQNQDAEQLMEESCIEQNQDATESLSVDISGVFSSDQPKCTDDVMVDTDSVSIYGFSTTKDLSRLCALEKTHPVNTNTAQYYSYDLKTSGQTFLVSKMLGNVTQYFTKLSPEEVAFQIRMSRFVSSLTIRQQTLFASLLKDLDAVYVSTKMHYEPVCPLPKHLSDLRRMYTEGENSIDRHLPIPTCTMIHDHSYVSIIDCIADVLLRNTKSIPCIDKWNETLVTNNAEDSNTMFYSIRFKEIINNAMTRVSNNAYATSSTVVPIFLTLWSDDFDPNRSIKANRQSVWIKTCTIFFMDQSGIKLETTFPIALSTKGSDHEVIEREVKKEILRLQSGQFISVYSRAHKQTVHVHAEIYCIMNDQPERRSNLGLSNGNSTCHSRFGVLMDCKQNKNVIRSCNDCSKSIELEVTDYINKTSDNRRDSWWRANCCEDCSAWMFSLSHPLLRYKPDKDFPLLFCDVEHLLEPKQITRELLQTTITRVHDLLLSSSITIAEAKSIMKYSGFNSAVQDQILESASNCKGMMAAFNEKDNDPENYNDYLNSKNMNPQAFMKFELPSAWYGFNDVKQYVDVPMHLLMLGIVKSVLLKIGVWLRLRNQQSLFLRMTNTVLGEVKSLNIHWCKILEYPSTDKFGGWVSENFLAMSRLANWFYSFVTFLPEADEYSDPRSNYKTWSKPMNQKWLEARGLLKTGKATDIKTRVARYFNENNIPPIVVKNECKNENILDMVTSMSHMMHQVMCCKMTEGSLRNLEATIRWFLTKYDIVDRGIIEKQTPAWITQYNFMCLLNLPDTIRMYGNVRHLWEGGSDGEGFLKRVKDKLKPGLVHQWQKWSLTSLLQDKLYAEWLSNNSETSKPLNVLRSECRIYNSRKKATAVIVSGKPFSGIMIANLCGASFYVCFRKCGTIKGLKLFVSDRVEEFVSRNYGTVSSTKEIIDIDLACTSDVVGVIFLPRLFDDGYRIKSRDTTYCIVSSSWT